MPEAWRVLQRPDALLWWEYAVGLVPSVELAPRVLLVSRRLLNGVEPLIERLHPGWLPMLFRATRLRQAMPCWIAPILHRGYVVTA